MGGLSPSFEHERPTPEDVPNDRYDGRGDDSDNYYGEEEEEEKMVPLEQGGRHNFDDHGDESDDDYDGETYLTMRPGEQLHIGVTLNSAMFAYPMVKDSWQTQLRLLFDLKRTSKANIDLYLDGRLLY